MLIAQWLAHGAFDAASRGLESQLFVKVCSKRTGCSITGCTIHDYFLYYLQYNLYKPLQITYTDEHFSHSEKIKN